MVDELKFYILFQIKMIAAAIAKANIKMAHPTGVREDFL